jgi:hypothetical protein
MPRFNLVSALLTVSVCLPLTALLALRPTADGPIDQLIEKIRTYAQTYPYEKAYLHTDRDTYLSGETIWMKSYLFYGETRGIDSTSGSIFIDLVSANGKRIVLDSRIKSVGGFGEGQLTLPETIETGRYTLRAYTTWMRNFSEDWYFTKPIDIIKPDAGLPDLFDVNAAPDVQFLPEGGQLVAGLNSRVALKALSPAGVGIDVEGFLLADKDTLLGFTSQHLGMGQFQFAPEAGKTYTAYARMTGTTTPYTSYTMPAVAATGYTMQVDNLGNKDNIRVFVSNNVPTASSPESGTSGPKVTLIAQVNGQLIHAVQAPVARKNFMAPIPRDKFPEGIVQITLFDPLMKPLCERLVYSSRNDHINLTLTPRKAAVGPRQRIEVDVTATNADGKPVAANLSMAVTDAAQQPKAQPNAPSLLTYLLLTSDLRGHIEQPGYYFDAANKDRFVKLDLLMMTQGWRRFTWPQVLADVLPPTKFAVDPGLTLSGTVYRGTGRVPAPGTSVTIMITRKDSASSQDMFAATTDNDGRFFVTNADLMDTTQVFVQASQGKNRNFTVVLDKLYSPNVRGVRVPLAPAPGAYDQLANFIKRQSEYQAIEAQIRRNREVQLQAVVVKAKKTDPYASQRGIFSNADASLKVDDIMASGALTILDMLRGRVAGVQVTGNGMDASVQIRGAGNFGGAIEPQFMIDGMAVDKSAVLNISPRDVAYIDVIKGAGAAMLGSRGAGGGINVIMKRGGSDNSSMANQAVPGVRIEKVVGFMPQRQFYVPRYDNPTPEEKVRPDYRATLYWIPTVRTDATGKATVSFFASDAKTTLRLRAEGTTLQGQPGAGEATMKVE